MVQKIYLKIPVNRNGFQDPPRIQWSPEKETALWNVISTSKRNELDWNRLSTEFQVPATFLQQQAYWMYERQLEQLRSTIEKGTLSDESLRNERSEKTLLEEQSRTVTGLFDKRDSIDTTKPLFASDPPREINSGEPHTSDLSDRSTSSSSASSSSSSEDNLNYGSMLLQRSRILSKAPPKYQDLEEDDEDELSQSHLFHEIEAKKTTTESSTSNFSSVSISKSALEEALLDTSHIKSNTS